MLPTYTCTEDDSHTPFSLLYYKITWFKFARYYYGAAIDQQHQAVIPLPTAALHQ